MPAQNGRGSFITDRPVAVLMVFVAAVVFGFFSFRRLPVALMPELNYPTLTVRTEYPGAAPEEVENEISRPVEEALGVINGLNRISSVSRAGVSDVVLEFLWGTDMSEASQDALEKLDLVFLPNEAERPLLLHFDPALDPVMELSLSGSGPRYRGESGLRRLRRIAELQLKRELEPIPGVAAVRVRGGLEEEIHVRVDEQALRRTGVSIQTVIDRLRQENINVAGGTVNEGDTEYMVRTLNEFADISQIAETIVKRTAYGDVKVKDIAEVVRSHKEREIVTRTNGEESVQIDIYKEAEANMVAVAQAVIHRVGQTEPDGASRSQWQGNIFKRDRDEKLAAWLHREEGAKLQVVADRSVFIQNSIDEVRNAAIAGGLLAVAVLFLFLKSPKATVIASLSIPMSLLITFAPLNIFGVTLNIMSLGGLALGIGMLVDSSIVVLESIFRCWSEGDGRREAAIRGVREVRGAVIASTLTSIAVFLPMVFVEGIAGQAFGDLGMAVVISLLASLAVAIFFIPMLASRRRPEWQSAASLDERSWTAWRHFQKDCALWRQDRRRYCIPYLWFRLLFAGSLELLGKGLMVGFGLLLAAVAKGLLPAFKWALHSLFAFPAVWMERFLVWVHRVYPLVLRWSLHHPKTMLLLMLVSITATALVGRTLGSELLPEVHQGEFTVEANLPVGTPLEETRRLMGEVEKRILANREGICALLVAYGYDATNIKRSDEGEHTARFKVLADTKSRASFEALTAGRSTAATEKRLLERIRGYLHDQPDITERVVRPVLFSASKPIVVEIQGDNLSTLRKIAQEAEALLQNHRELADVETTLRRGAPEIQIAYDRQRLSRYGLNLGQVAEQIKNLVKGFEATRYNLKDRRIPIIVQLEEADRRLMQQIENLAVNRRTDGNPNTASQPPIPLNAVASLHLGEGPSEIRRVDGKRVALIQANLGQASLGEAVAKIENTLSTQLDWPAGMSFVFAGQNEEWERSRTSLYLALGLSIFLVYVIMASQFESLWQPLIIMGTVPLAFFGSVIGLKLLGINLSIVVFLGWILLIGIVVNNAIVLVDYTNILRRRGLTLEEAVLTAGKVRLRPILMTTATTIFGLLPMALGLGDGAEIRTPMAIAVIFGLASSTALTLLVIPTIYLWADHLQSALIKPQNKAENPTNPTA